MSDLNKIFAKNLLNVLDRIDRKPAWLAEKSGIAKSQVGRILKGETSTTLETIQKLATALELLPSELISKDGKTNTYTPIEASSTDLAVKLSPKVVNEGPTVRDAALILLRLGEVSPERRAVALAFLMDDPSLVPDDAEHAPFLDLLKSR